MTELTHLMNKHHKLDLEIAYIQSRKTELLHDDELAKLHKLKKKKSASVLLNMG